MSAYTALNTKCIAIATFPDSLGKVSLLPERGRGYHVYVDVQLGCSPRLTLSMTIGKGEKCMLPVNSEGRVLLAYVDKDLKSVVGQTVSIFKGDCTVVSAKFKAWGGITDACAM